MNEDITTLSSCHLKEQTAIDSIIDSISKGILETAHAREMYKMYNCIVPSAFVLIAESLVTFL